MRRKQMDLSSSSSSSSTSSSINTSSQACHVPSSASSSPCKHKRDYSTDLRLGLSTTSAKWSNISEHRSDWLAMKPAWRRKLAKNENNGKQETFFIKIYMEGDPIGRKINLLGHKGYDSLIKALQHMFCTTILCPNISKVGPSRSSHVLTYEDKKGDWLIVGDVPWEKFLSSVQRLKIKRADKYW